MLYWNDAIHLSLWVCNILGGWNFSPKRPRRCKDNSYESLRSHYYRYIDPSLPFTRWVLTKVRGRVKATVMNCVSSITISICLFLLLIRVCGSLQFRDALFKLSASGKTRWIFKLSMWLDLDYSRLCIHDLVHSTKHQFSFVPFVWSYHFSVIGHLSQTQFL